MKEHPIIFSGDMIRAIAEGRKTQTRRVIKPQPRSLINGWPTMPDKRKKPLQISVPSMTTGGAGIGFGSHLAEIYPSKPMPSRYGTPGDHLWVRETWALLPLYDCMRPSQLCPKGLDLFWKANGAQTRYYKTNPGRWRSPIHMPHWASRYTLEILDVRVQQLQDISPDDAEAEGVPIRGCAFPKGGSIRIDAFAELWDSINGKKPGLDWKSNPWVWALTFRLI